MKVLEIVNDVVYADEEYLMRLIFEKGVLVSTSEIELDADHRKILEFWDVDGSVLTVTHDVRRTPVERLGEDGNIHMTYNMVITERRLCRHGALGREAYTPKEEWIELN